MDWIHVVALAVIQGLTEFLPISSSAHLILPKELLGWPDQGLAFDVAVHVGTLLAVLAYFRNDVQAMIVDWFASLTGKPATANSRLAWYVIGATVPVGIVGFLFDDFIEANLRSMAVIAATTIIFGLLLWWADRRGSRQYTSEQMQWRAALMIGFAQVLALIPGTSRSGITITAALMLGYEREAAARFSFLLSIPLIAIAGLFKVMELVQAGGSVPWLHIAAGTAISAITAYLTIHWFLKLLDRVGMLPFVIYRLVLGIVIIGILAM